MNKALHISDIGEHLIAFRVCVCVDAVGAALWYYSYASLAAELQLAVTFAAVGPPQVRDPSSVSDM